MHPAMNPQVITDKYCWIIDVDHEADPSQPAPSNLNAVGMMGGAGADTSLVTDDGEHEKFRMYDDDDNLYYEGRIFGDYEGFEPLDDFGMPNAGAVDIRYLSNTGQWESL